MVCRLRLVAEAQLRVGRFVFVRISMLEEEGRRSWFGERRSLYVGDFEVEIVV